MRIIAGRHKGRPIAAPEGLDTRPTTDRVRESVMSSLFSMLGGFEGVVALDAFSGSGAMALEALSRGAASCVMNDFAASSRRVIEANRDYLGYSAAVARVTGADILKHGVPGVGGPFGLAFFDPPYPTPAEDVLAIVADAFSSGAFSPDAVVVYEHGERMAEDAPEAFGLAAASQKKYGKTHVTYLVSAATASGAAPEGAAGGAREGAEHEGASGATDEPAGAAAGEGR